MALASSNSDHLTQSELEATLWAAANALRGPVEAGDFKAYVFPVLFFKWISDMHDYNHQLAVEDLGDDWTKEFEADYQTFEVPEDATWAEVFKTTTNLGAKLNRALVAIQEANPGKLAGVFGDVNWANKDRLPENALRNLLRAFDKLTLNPDFVSGDMLGAAYEYLLREFAEASGRKAGEFFTPRHVVHLLVKLLEPQPGESMYDPACGSAGMLVEAVEATRNAGGNPRALFLYGQELNLTTAGIARMNLYLHGLEDFSIARGDTFSEPKHLDASGALKQFDVVLANPPFSLQGWGADSWATDPHGRALGGIIPPAGKGDWAWIQHMIASMNPDGGRVGVVMPHGVLFRGGEEGRIREWVIRENLLEAVISLPNNLFYSTSIPVCILIFRAQKPADRQNKVLFVDAREKYSPGKNQNSLSDDDVKVIDAAVKRGIDIDGDEGLSLRLVNLDEIEQNGFDLNVGRYLQTETAAEADVDAALATLREAQDTLAKATIALDERLKAAGFHA